MDIVYVDFETYWDQEYSLSKMDARTYIADPRFEIIGASVAVNNERVAWLYDIAELDIWLRTIDWSKVAFCAHNTKFDGGILTWRFNRRPRLWLDTLSMANARIKPFTGSVSLGAVAEYLGLPVNKGNYTHKMKGVRKAQMTRAMLDGYGDYASDDLVMCRLACHQLLPQFPQSELKLIDRTMRMYLEPKLMLNPDVLYRHLERQKKIKAELLAQIEHTKADIMSNDKFADALLSFGVEPPTKISPTTGKQTYAFSKKDLDFLALQEHPDERVQHLMAARLGVKTTIEESRTQRLLDIAHAHRTLAVPLGYARAHTLRFGGEDKLNLQNLPGVWDMKNDCRHETTLRDSIEAPEGYKLVVADASQIEARMLAWQAGQDNIVQAFANHEDVYAVAAEGIYGYSVNKKEQPLERKVGKVATLQLGYASGAPTFWTMCKLSGVEISMQDADYITSRWRDNNPRIVKLWDLLFQTCKDVWLNKIDTEVEIYPVKIGYSREHEAGYILLPNGMPLWYPKPGMRENKFGRHGFGYMKIGKTPASTWHQLLWKGAIQNNVTQALARVATMEHALLISQYPVAPWALQVHDELVFVVKNQHVDRVMEACQLVMTRSPEWAEGLPLDCEVGASQRYGDAK